MLSFITPISIDNEQRVVNIQQCVKYYTEKFNIKTEFILVEQSPTIESVNHSYINKIDKYIYIKSDMSFKKTKSYNQGARVAEGNVLCFLDSDIFINKQTLESLYQQVLNTDGIFLGYNGAAIYTTETGKSKFIDSINKSTWNEVCTLVDFNNLRTNYYTKDYLVGNTRAVGGCLIMNKQTFYKIKGFNPNFTGWGYEDNEIISRARILNVPISKVDSQNDILIHLWHDVANVDKSKHTHYRDNENEVRKVEAMNKLQLEEYIKTWNV